eukprot:TRINITY_DN0_c0_g1_i4.p1 TRINITY_DN0_c0_g1~~TRINITY_DN0_c0_g1_i4.p1  ORF type:complete len:487 (-),score=101.28 TRINITY_DN0_c0_g1_i4:221-1681(-)
MVRQAMSKPSFSCDQCMAEFKRPIDLRKHSKTCGTARSIARQSCSPKRGSPKWQLPSPPANPARSRVLPNGILEYDVFNDASSGGFNELDFLGLGEGLLDSCLVSRERADSGNSILASGSVPSCGSQCGSDDYLSSSSGESTPQSASRAAPRNRRRSTTLPDMDRSTLELIQIDCELLLQDMNTAPDQLPSSLQHQRLGSPVGRARSKQLRRSVLEEQPPRKRRGSTSLPDRDASEFDHIQLDCELELQQQQSRGPEASPVWYKAKPQLQSGLLAGMETADVPSWMLRQLHTSVKQTLTRTPRRSRRGSTSLPDLDRTAADLLDLDPDLWLQTVDDELDEIDDRFIEGGESDDDCPFGPSGSALSNGDPEVKLEAQGGTVVECTDQVSQCHDKVSQEQPRRRRRSKSLPLNGATLASVEEDASTKPRRSRRERRPSVDKQSKQRAVDSSLVEAGISCGDWVPHHAGDILEFDADELAALWSNREKR